MSTKTLLIIVGSLAGANLIVLAIIYFKSLRPLLKDGWSGVFKFFDSFITGNDGLRSSVRGINIVWSIFNLFMVRYAIVEGKTIPDNILVFMAMVSGVNLGVMGANKFSEVSLAKVKSQETTKKQEILVAAASTEDEVPPEIPIRETEE